jgi:hypothetical protein
MVFRRELDATFGARIFATGILRSPDGRHKLRKDLYYLEVLALKVPFGIAYFPNEVPWPGQLRT